MKKFVNKIKSTNGYQEQKVFFQQKIDAEKARIAHKHNEKQALAQNAAQDPAPQETQDHVLVTPAPQEAAVAHQPLDVPALEAGNQASDALEFEIDQLLAKHPMSNVTKSDLNEMLIDIVKAISTEQDKVELDDTLGTDTEMVVTIGTMPELPL